MEAGKAASSEAGKSSVDYFKKMFNKDATLKKQKQSPQLRDVESGEIRKWLISPVGTLSKSEIKEIAKTLKSLDQNREQSISINVNNKVEEISNTQVDIKNGLLINTTDGPVTLNTQNGTQGVQIIGNNNNPQVYINSPNAVQNVTQWYQGTWHVDVDKTMKLNADNIEKLNAHIAKLVAKLGIPLPYNLDEFLKSITYKFYKNHGVKKMPGANNNSNNSKQIGNVNTTSYSYYSSIGLQEFHITPISDSSATLTLNNPNNTEPTPEYIRVAPKLMEIELVNDPKKGVYITENMQLSSCIDCDPAIPKGNEKFEYQNLDFNMFLKKTEEGH